MEHSVHTLAEGTVHPVQSPKKKGFPIRVPTNKEPERSIGNRSFGVEDEAKFLSKKRKTSSTKNMGYRPTSSSYFSSPKKPPPSIKMDKSISTTSFYGNQVSAIETKFTDDFIYRHKNKERNINKEKHRNSLGASNGGFDRPKMEIIDLDNDVASSSDDNNEVFERVPVKSRSEPASATKNFSDEGLRGLFTRVENMKSNTSENAGRRLGGFPSILVKRLRINDEKVKVGRHQLRIHENIALVSDYGDTKSLSVSNIDSAKYNMDGIKCPLLVFVFNDGKEQWICEIQNRDDFPQFRLSCAPFVKFVSMSLNEKKNYEMILENPPEGMRGSLRRKSDSSIYSGYETRPARRSQTDYAEDDLVPKEKFKFRVGRERLSDEEYARFILCIRMFLYPFTGRNRVTILVEHAMRLSPQEYLNDTIIEFYIKYLCNETLRPEIIEKTHIFNSFFFEQLSKKDTQNKDGGIDFGYSLVKSWTNKVDIFSKDFIVIPINENFHWYMAIVVNPKALIPNNAKNLASDSDSIHSAIRTAEYDSIDSCSSTLSEPISNMEPRNIMIPSSDDVAMQDSNVNDTSKPENNFIGILKAEQKFMAQRERCTCIIFDSLGSNHSSAITTITKYLTKEAQEKKNVEITEKIHRIHAKVPRQPNHCDCGVFLLQFFEDFMKDPEGKLRLIFARKGEASDWFDIGKIEKKRREIFELVQDVEEQYQKFTAKT